MYIIHSSSISKQLVKENEGMVESGLRGIRDLAYGCWSQGTVYTSSNIISIYVHDRGLLENV